MLEDSNSGRTLMVAVERSKILSELFTVANMTRLWSFILLFIGLFPSNTRQ